MQTWFRAGLPGVAVVLFATGCQAFGAEETPAVSNAAALSSAAPAPSSTVATGEPEINAQEAQDIALEAVGGGWILKTETDDKDDVLMVWEVTVVAPAGEHRQVTVDMTDGTVLGHELDD